MALKSVLVAYLVLLSACLSSQKQVVDTREVLRVKPPTNRKASWDLTQGARSLSERQFFTIAGDEVSVARVHHTQERARYLYATGAAMIGAALICGALAVLADESLGQRMYGGAGLGLAGSGTFLMIDNARTLEPKHRSIEREIAERAARSYNARYQLSLKAQF